MNVEILRISLIVKVRSSDKMGFIELTGDLIRHGCAVPPSPEGKAKYWLTRDPKAFPSGEGGRSEAEVG